jgi:hypothetical protein
MEVENSITSACFKDLERGTGTAFAVELYGKTHICIKVFENTFSEEFDDEDLPPKDFNYYYLFLRPGHPDFNAPGLADKKALERNCPKSENVAVLSSLIFRVSSA